jgi:hypothetical protein
MIASFLLLLLVAPEGAAEPPCEYCGAIFDDVRLNAMIGNGNVEVSSEWAIGRANDDVSIRVEELSCPEGRKRKTCTFTLHRILKRNGVVTTDPVLPGRLHCTAILKWFDAPEIAGWEVEHYPPRGGGHSRTSMTCKPAQEAS